MIQMISSSSCWMITSVNHVQNLLLFIMATGSIVIKIACNVLLKMYWANKWCTVQQWCLMTWVKDCYCRLTFVGLHQRQLLSNSPSHNFTNLGNQIPVYLLPKVCFSIPEHCCCTICMLTLIIYSFLCFAGMWVGAIIPVYSKDMNMYHNVEYQFWCITEVKVTNYLSSASINCMSLCHFLRTIHRYTKKILGNVYVDETK